MREANSRRQAAGGIADHIGGIDMVARLQELAQSLRLPQPRYAIVEERGPEHAKIFMVEVRVGREWMSRAEGLSKKSAGQKAAQDILRQLAESGG